MTIKYHCRKCGKRFVDWGAEKLGYKCPDCGDEDLVRIGAAEDRAVKRPSLKRKTKRATPAISTVDDVVMPEIDELDEDELEDEEKAFVSPLADAGPAEFDIEDAVVPADVDDDAELEIAEDLAFENVTPPLGEEAIDEALPEGDDWANEHI